MYEVQQQLHMRNVEHHLSPNSPSRLLNIHNANQLQSNPPMHQPQKNLHLQQPNQVKIVYYSTF